MKSKRDNEWLEYYEEFRPHFTRSKVRDGCHPRILTRPKARGSVVLVHGLSDSPYYMVDIANHFYEQLGYNVLLPLLHYHGLKNPLGMEGVELEEWKRNVSWAVEQAASLPPQKVSIGGLSTGGALSFYTACVSPRITGDVYLFSAALDLTVKRLGRLGDIVERVLRSKKLVDFLDERDQDKPLIGDNPVKYDYIDKDGARELVRLIKETDVLMEAFDKKHPFPGRVFAAHSYADDTAAIAGVQNLQSRMPKKNFRAFYIERELDVSHAGLVLKNDVVGNSGQICTGKNRVFDKMMRSLDRFAG